MNKQVGNAKYRILWRLSKSKLHLFTVLFAYNAVEGKGKSGPLIFLDTTIVMGIKKGKVRILV